ncbi:hypothetical protein [Planotetraspora sp. GP83]|uniref:hypothetical protein n=1 Tax=Planotetraspora sp. GP83 TaxID=3156264 RepID=UPI003517B9E7
MSTPVKALVTATSASLIAVIAATLAGAHLLLWAVWAALAAVTIAVVAIDRRREV